MGSKTWSINTPQKLSLIHPVHQVKIDIDGIVHDYLYDQIRNERERYIQGYDSHMADWVINHTPFLLAVRTREHALVLAEYSFRRKHSEFGGSTPILTTNLFFSEEGASPEDLEGYLLHHHPKNIYVGNTLDLGLMQEVTKCLNYRVLTPHDKIYVEAKKRVSISILVDSIILEPHGHKLAFEEYEVKGLICMSPEQVTCGQGPRARVQLTKGVGTIEDFQRWNEKHPYLKEGKHALIVADFAFAGQLAFHLYKTDFDVTVQYFRTKRSDE